MRFSSFISLCLWVLYGWAEARHGLDGFGPRGGGFDPGMGPPPGGQGPPLGQGGPPPGQGGPPPGLGGPPPGQGLNRGWFQPGGFSSNTQAHYSWLEKATSDSNSAALNGNNVCGQTVQAVEGPYYKSGSPQRADGTICDYQNLKNGTQLLVKGKVYGAQCAKEVPALLDIWEANPQGVYSSRTGADFTCRGKVTTDQNGNYQFLTTIPGYYSGRAAHIHLKVSPTSQPSNILTTQLFFKGDPALAYDHCPVCGAGDPTTTFPAERSSDKSYMMTANIVLNV